MSDAAFSELPPLARATLRALALGAAWRTRTWLWGLLADPAARPGVAKRPTQEELRAQIPQLDAAGWLSEDARRPGYWQVAPQHLATVWLPLLADERVDTLRARLAQADGYPAELGLHRYQAGFPHLEAAVARLRLEWLAGASPEEMGRLDRFLPWGWRGLDELREAVEGGLTDPALLARVHPAHRAQWHERALTQMLANFDGADLPALRRSTAALLAGDEGPHTYNLRLLWAEALVLSDQADQAGQLPAVLAPLQRPEANQPDPGAYALGFETAVAAWRGDWAAAEMAGDAAIARLRKASGKRRGVLGAYGALAYALALIAQRTPAHLAKALKFCLAEGGKREPQLDSPFGYLALALRMRLGEQPRDAAPFRPYVVAQAAYRDYVSPLDPWRWLMRAWLKDGDAPEPLPPAEADAARRLKERLQRAGLAVLERQLDAALRVLAGEPAPAGFFVPPPEAPWQHALAALAAIAGPAPATAGEPDARLLWLLALDAHGRPEALVPHEQKRGVRGWGKPKEVPLSRLHKTAQALAPQDTRVALAIRPERYGHQLRLDLASAVGALVGHPCWAFADAPEQLVELSESGPELDVQREGDMLRVRMLPAPHAGRDTAQGPWTVSAAEQAEREALRATTVLRDGPQRARLVRLNEAQRRAAQLLGRDGLRLPAQAAGQLQQVLAGLGTQFRIQADDAATAQAARDVPAEPRLRAELQPVDDGLQLRLVACPYGADYAADGPRTVPGGGRARLVTRLRGELLGVQRDLAREREHLSTVLDACPMLMEPPDGAPCEWQIDEPELALALVERLHTLNAVMALDWPQGRPVRVVPGALSQLVLKVQTRQDWLAVQGELKIDEALVVGLQQLIAFAAGGKSRFMPLGEGRYLALTQDLRERMADLAAVAESHQQRGQALADLRVPTLAAPWMQQIAEGAQVDFDVAFGQRLQRLDEARRVVPAVPATLQAELRPYQEEGVEWALRLAHAGLGACLADDMGLGKTLQALAVLLARAGHGPALVVAPTSLLGNWRAEARRFAPSLRMHLYAEGGAPAERAQRLDALAAQDVLLVSYPMLQIDAAAFAKRLWHTLVLDEAQAIKNAAAKRSQAVFELQADFRLALSGTPIENRLAELWSVMNACNPGLLGTASRFGERFVGPIERQRDRHAQRTLRRLIAPFILRRTKTQVLDDLPPRTELVLRIPSDAQETAHYEALRRETLIAAERSLSGDAPGQAQLNILAGLTRLRRAACDPRLVSPQLNLTGAKVQAFAELAAELVANGHKALVFSQFVDFLALLRAPLDAAGIAYQYLDGSTPAAERTRRVDAFQNGEGELFLISLKAGGFGLNLTLADYVIIADPWWNPAAEDQASGRAHRIGQQRPVTVYRLVREGTLEERIVALHASKRELADQVLDGTGVRAAPPPDELLALMRGDTALAAGYESETSYP